MSDIQPIEPNKVSTADKPRELTAKNRVFLDLIASGKSTLEAYKEAGYQGSEHAAYQLRSELKEELIKALEARGVDRAGLMSQLGELLRLPINEAEKDRGVSIKQKISILSLLAKTLPQEKTDEKPRITAFVVNQTIPGQPKQTIEVQQKDD